MYSHSVSSEKERKKISKAIKKFYFKEKDGDFKFSSKKALEVGKKFSNKLIQSNISV